MRDVVRENWKEMGDTDGRENEQRNLRERERGGVNNKEKT